VWLVAYTFLQTGSGKTFTITGGAEKYADRGIIPRTLSYVFRHFQENPQKIFTIHVSYLEIYNEHGYDLLDPRQEASKLEDLPYVRGGGVGLGCHAQTLLYSTGIHWNLPIGDTSVPVGVFGVV
jgi:hypothetical protein